MSTINDGFKIVDYTFMNELMPRLPSFLQDLGLFSSMQKFYHTDTSARLERVIDGVDKIQAQKRGGNRQKAGREKAMVRSVEAPYFTMDSMFAAQDIQDYKEYGTTDTPMSMQSRMERTRGRIANDWAVHKERARYAALKGFSYSPEDTDFEYDYANLFEVSSIKLAELTVDFSDAAADPRVTINNYFRPHLAKYAGNNATGFKLLVLCGNSFFNKVISHETTKEAYGKYPSESEPFRKRLGGDAINQSWESMNLTFLEDSMGQQIGEIPDDGFILVPLGIDGMFQEHYCPADHKKYANQPALEMYQFMLESERTDRFETECSHLMVNTRPELIGTGKSN